MKESDIAFIVVEAESPLCMEAREKVLAMTRQAVDASPLKGTPVALLHGGMKLRIVRNCAVAEIIDELNGGGFEEAAKHLEGRYGATVKAVSA